MSVEDTLVKMAQDRTPPDYLADNLWVSKPQTKRSTARQLAALAVKFTDCGCPKFGVALDSPGHWRGLVWAGRRSRREVAKAGA